MVGIEVISGRKGILGCSKRPSISAYSIFPCRGALWTFEDDSSIMPAEKHSVNDE